MTQSSPEPTKDSSPLIVERPMLYRCACGFEFPVDPTLGGICPSCLRRIQGAALLLASSATVTLHNLREKEDSHDFSSAALELAEGTMLGHFRLDRRIGKGGMGAVYRALDTSLERYVAVKVVHSSDGSSGGQIESILREAVAQARLNHPNVVTIYYVGRHKEEPFLAMELVDGPTLAEQIKSGTMTYGAAIQAAIDVANALQHSAIFDIVHADIKPSNLLLSSNGTLKLSDFGLSWTSASKNYGRPISGTPSYLAPEIFEGGAVSHQSDMYALGITLFELVFGRLPFELQGETLREQLSTHKTAAIDFPNPWPVNIPRGFALVIQRLLEKEPLDRYPDYDSLSADLQSIQPSKTTIAGLASRAMAYFLDQLMLLAMFTPFAAAILYLQTKPLSYQGLIPLIALASLVVPVGYLLQMRRGVSSLGRYLFQLRISEENGLPPGREQLLTREIFRNLLAWIIPLGAYFSLYYSPALSIFVRAMGGFMVAELVCVLVTRHRRTLHDLLCRSRVVLDVNRPSPLKKLVK